jgi:hypothetical protein
MLDPNLISISAMREAYGLYPYEVGQAVKALGVVRDPLSELFSEDETPKPRDYSDIAQCGGAWTEIIYLDKKSVVLFMYGCGKELQRQVPELNQRLVDDIIEAHHREPVPVVSVSSARQVDAPAVSSPVGQEKTSVATPQDDSRETAIRAWEAVLPQLSGADLKAAKLVIAKWQRKTHAEAFDAVRPDGKDYVTPKSKQQAVSREKSRAENIAQRFNLPMPNWNSSR